MTKKVLLGLAVGLSLSTAASAAPLQDYHAGKVEANVGTSLTPCLHVGQESGAEVTDGVKHDLNGGVTVGLGGRFAAQFRYVGNKQESSLLSGSTFKVRTQEYNIRYQLNKNISLYTGEMHAHGDFQSKNYSAEDSRSIWQGGVQYEAPIAKNLIGWTSVGFGKSMQHYEAGVGYAVTPNLDIDLSYQYTKISDFHWNRVTADYHATFQGLYMGLSYKL